MKKIPAGFERRAYKMLRSLLSKDLAASNLTDVRVRVGLPMGWVYVKTPQIGMECSSGGVTRVAASQVMVRQKTIVLHQQLAFDLVPDYVLRYLLRHECLHLLLPPRKGEDPHHNNFLLMDRASARRSMALRWLWKKNYATPPV